MPSDRVALAKTVSITRHIGSPLHHSIPTVNLTSADIEILNYLQDQGLWRHNITIRSARDILNKSSFAAKATRLAHIVRWVKKYGNDPSEGGNHEGNRQNAHEGNREGNREAEKGTAQVSEGNREGTAEKEKKQGKGIIPPPCKGGMNHPTILDGEEELPIPW